jgi:alkanesulfonate monooxygenase SsuD/methylene tetrahydromethanopterin reductase-like flavin-dependent oxidoreductase (luciferase family)
MGRQVLHKRGARAGGSRSDPQSGGPGPSSPFGVASVSLRVYPSSPEPRRAVDELVGQAEAAERAGFDGLMTSEHHGGFANYLPNPLLVTTWLLAATTHVWAAPSPLLLPLRPVHQLIEDLAWSAARFFGRLGAGFAAGALETDFEIAGVPFEERVSRFSSALQLLAAAFGTAAAPPNPELLGALQRDPAVAAGPPLSMVVAAQSLAGARRAAALGFGVLYNSLQDLDWLRRLSEGYRAHGGQGPVVLIRRVMLGVPEPSMLTEHRRRYETYASPAAKAHWDPNDAILADPDPKALGERLADAMRRSGADAINLRIHLAGMAQADAREQLQAIGDLVLPHLRRALGLHVSRADAAASGKPQNGRNGA